MNFDVEYDFERPGDSVAATMTLRMDEALRALLLRAFEAGATRSLCSCGTPSCKAERTLAFREWLAEVIDGE